MKITVVSVDRVGAGLRIVLADPIYQRPEFTDIGNRFLRTIYRHGRTGYGIENNVFTGGKDVSAINTRDALQEELDRFANAPIKLRFQESVRAYPTTDEQRQAWPNPILTRMDEVKRAYREGVNVLLEIAVFSNLPFTDRDHDRLSKFVPGGVHNITDPQESRHSEPFMALNVWMHGERSGKDPWALAKMLRPKIQKAIV